MDETGVTVITLTSHAEWADFWRRNRAALEEAEDDHDDTAWPRRTGAF